MWSRDARCRRKSRFRDAPKSERRSLREPERVNQSSFSFSLSLFRRDDCRRGLAEARRLDRNIRLDVAELDDRLTIRPGHHGMERHFHTGDIAVIGIINLNWNCADRRVRIAELSQKQSRLIIEEQFDT